MTDLSTLPGQETRYKEKATAGALELLREEFGNAPSGRRERAPTGLMPPRYSSCHTHHSHLSVISGKDKTSIGQLKPGSGLPTIVKGRLEAYQLSGSSFFYRRTQHSPQGSAYSSSEYQS